MSSGFQAPITIKNVIDKIHNRQYLLPAIQRKFTWSSSQIEMLFDSIMRGYPINSFMFWKITDDNIKSDYKFYEFITKFREFFLENNRDIDTKGVHDFEAVIDGQQRLTSLYIGLRGSYAYKMPRKWWKDNEECIPTRELYLNLIVPINQEYDNQKEFDFRFLSKFDLEKFNKDKDKDKDKYFWFRVGEILNLDIDKFINNNNLRSNDYACKTLFQLHSVIHSKKLINYYLQEEQEPDKVLEIFIRTNSGGTPLSFSDLLMSIATSNWKEKDARSEMNKLIEEVYEIGHSSFIIDKDFILKSCLFLFVDDIKFQLKNFTYENVNKFEINWNKIRSSIIAAFSLFNSLGFKDKTFRAKNAAIPVIYYIYYNNLETIIFSAIYKDKENKSRIAKWLILTFIKSIFGGQTDSVLKKMRTVLKENLGVKFPDKELMEIFKNDPARNYNFDDEFIDKLLEAEKDSTTAYYILHLLYSDLDFSNHEFHQDHLHPATIFVEKEKFDKVIPIEIQDFARQKINWNGIGNLQLLNGIQNNSKNDKSLKEWVVAENKKNEDLFLSPGVSLEIKDFKEFIIDRKANMKRYIKNLVY
ncbi:DUF262 domain-containing protein [Fusobacterium sp.]|uniref:DUF262 domain-containing protein n=1 Tax=Fusobacterium sp. TaxID=68766 RepID=UPI00262778BE|nr:DUF262 domain-containing protein [Fusobacterium sp.]